jgi:hypothetical protein
VPRRWRTAAASARSGTAPVQPRDNLGPAGALPCASTGLAGALHTRPHRPYR